MEPEISQYESSDMLATYLASTPLLEESWRMCKHANMKAHMSFAVNRIGRVTYVAFSGVQAVDCSEESCGSLVDLDSGAKGIFRAVFDRDRQPVMIHGGLLQLFLLYHHTNAFNHKMLEILNESKSIVFTGQSLGGAIASIAALWLLSIIQNDSISAEVLCITYGSPMLGNESFSQVILQERWSGNFCHVVAPHDIMPRMLFARATPLTPQFLALFEFWQSSMASPHYIHKFASKLTQKIKADIFDTVLAYTEERAKGGEEEEKNLFWPFGTYMFCTDKGAICLDNKMTIVRLLFLMLATGSADSFVEDHLKYDVYVAKIGWQFLQQKTLTHTYISESSNDAGLELALQSSGIAFKEPLYEIAKECLEMARQLGCRRSLNNAKMAVSLAKVTPLRAQIEWYKAFCNNSEDHLGYYDAFKRRIASRSINKVNMNRIKLGRFWDELISMMESNQLTHDFHKLPKYVYASHFYKLLVEPLEIAKYYGTEMHKKKGHYIEHGREKRFKIFDKWWRDRKVGAEERTPRSMFASLTQDSCFWARVEEARDAMYCIPGEMDLVKRKILLDKIQKFEKYASKMIERKEVSVDVLAKSSSYNLFIEEWKELKTRVELLPLLFSVGQEAIVQDTLEVENPFLLALQDGKLVS